MTRHTKLFPLFLLLIISAAVALYPQPSGPALAQQPDTVFGLESVVNLGVAAGNGNQPRHVALNPADQRLYVLSDGSVNLQDGNDLNIYDLETGQFVAHRHLNSGDNEPLDVQHDAETNAVYALWRERYGSERPTLSVLDDANLQPRQEIPDVEAFAIEQGQLYAANADELLTVNLANNSLSQARRVTFDTTATAVGPLAVDAAAGRLYLARQTDAGWAIDIFDAADLSLLVSVPTEGAALNILPLPNGANEEQFFAVVAQSGYHALYRFTAQGDLADLPYDLGPASGARGVALSPDGRTLFFSNNLYPPTGPDDPSPGPALIGLDSATLTESHFIPLLSNVADVVIHPDSGQAFAVYPFDHLLYQIDLAAGDTTPIKTLIQVRDLLVEPELGRIYVTDSANRVRRLDPETLAVLTETTLQNNWADFGFGKSANSGHLSHDRRRGRLYISGLPATVVDLDVLDEVKTLEPGGQIAADGASDVVYLSNCGVTMLDANTLGDGQLLPGSGPRPDGLAPNPCVTAGRLDAANNRLYSTVYNGVPGSNGGSYLMVYDVALTPTAVYSDADIGLAAVEPHPTANRAFVSYSRNSNSRLRTLTLPAESGGYTHQLKGVWGAIHYSPRTERLYLLDDSLKRLLALDAATLSVVDEAPLPANGSYRLLALDAAAGDRLFVADQQGNLLLYSPTAAALDDDLTALSSPPAEAPAEGAVLSLTAPPAGAPVFGRVQTSIGSFSSVARLYQTEAAGQPWQHLSSRLPPDVAISAVAVSPDFAADSTLFAGVLLPGQSGGLYKSTDGGQSWQPAMAGLQDLWVEALVIAPDFADSGLILAETTYGGVHYSADGGQSWQPVSPGDPNLPFPPAGSEQAAAVSAEALLAGQSLPEMRGVFRAQRQPGGNIGPWQPVLDIPLSHLTFSPDGQTVLGYGAALWRSVDGGQRWQMGGAGLPSLDSYTVANIFFSPDFVRDETAYIFYSDSDRPGILYRSTDGGQSWQPWRSPDEDTAFTAAALTAGGDLLLGDAAAGLTRLPLDDLTWAPMTLPTAPFPLDDIAVSPDFAIDQTVFALSSQEGLFVTRNGGRSWQRTDFLPRTRSFTLKKYRLAISPNFAADQTIFAATGLSLHRSTDGGQSWQQLLSEPEALSFQVQQVAVSPNFAADQSVLATTPLTLYRSTDGGDTWQAALTNESDAPLSSDVLTFAPDGQTAYARFSYGSPLYRSSDGGQSWNARPAERDEFFTIISAAANADTLSAAVEYERKLLQSPPWQEVSQSLPEALTSVNTLAYQPDQTLLVGGAGGIFSSADNGQNWQALDTIGLPDGAVVSLLRLGDGGPVIALDDGQLYRRSAAGWQNISIVK